MTSQRLANVAYLDALRPDPGWHMEFAFLASYSADLVALVAALLAISGRDDDRGSGSKVDFVTAIERTADRVRLILQAGRLVAPAKTPRILSILDRYVREVRHDESIRSWHPKATLCKHKRNDSHEVQWRLWIGSRNLTRDISWDSGLTLVSSPNSSGIEVTGIEELAAELATHAQLPGVAAEVVRSQLRTVRWEVPDGCTVRNLRMFTNNAKRTLPTAPAGLQKVVLVSPFLDGDIVSKIARWGDHSTRRLIVSSMLELAKLQHQEAKPLTGFEQLLCMDAPVPDDQFASIDADKENAKSDDEEPEPRGLHAKLLYAETETEHLLWTGSANFTQRGWQGPNSEIIAELKVSDEIAAGINDFVSRARTVQVHEMGAATEIDPTEEALECSRKEVCTVWNVRQTLRSGGSSLTATDDPNPTNPTVTLAVGTLVSDLVAWPRGATEISLPLMSAVDVTELLRCRLFLNDKSVTWLMRAPLDPAPDADRDRLAIANYLDPKSFLAWIRSLLTEETAGDGGGEWDRSDHDFHSRNVRTTGPTWWIPTLEEVLKAWARDPASLKSVDRKLRDYLAIIRSDSTDKVTQADRHAIDQFHQTWLVLSKALIGVSG